MGNDMDTSRKNATPNRRLRLIVVAGLALIALGIAAPPLLSGDTRHERVEWTVLPAARAPWLPPPELASGCGVVRP